ncbi:hypothetical protein J4530_08660 [Neisseria subflava]|uniref:hypothetical protein n=1 Tax=Neisseria subflava TaxID=28449 RepID=UPI00202A9E3C|nr:hypothetical protein [Neisseria subflava]MCL9788227.1 hypothetical protein [Neisseria subflava]
MGNGGSRPRKKQRPAYRNTQIRSRRPAPNHFRLLKRESNHENIILKLICAAIAATALAAVPISTRTTLSAARRAKHRQRAIQRRNHRRQRPAGRSRSRAAARQYEEMTDYQIMRGVVYEPEAGNEPALAALQNPACNKYQAISPAPCSDERKIAEIQNTPTDKETQK